MIADAAAKAPMTPVPTSGTLEYSLESITETRTVQVRGVQFTILCSSQAWHPSSWSFCDEAETRELWWDVKPGDVVLDIGADFGSYALSALALGAESVIAWSPPYKLAEVPLEALTMRLSAWQNGYESRLVVHESGLWSERGWLAAFDGPRPAQLLATRSAALATIANQPGHVSVFPVQALDSMQGHLLRADWVKIDTEGCELHILRGSEQTLSRLRPKILMEHHYHIDAQCEFKCDDFLSSLGYAKVGTRPHHSVSHSLYVPGPRP